MAFCVGVSAVLSEESRGPSTTLIPQKCRFPYVGTTGIPNMQTSQEDPLCHPPDGRLAPLPDGNCCREPEHSRKPPQPPDLPGTPSCIANWASELFRHAFNSKAFAITNLTPLNNAKAAQMIRIIWTAYRSSHGGSSYSRRMRLVG